MNEIEIIEEIQNGKHDNFKVILESYHNMIYKIINNFNLVRGEFCLSEEDLYQEASMALYDACIHYKNDKGAIFSTFAYTIIKRRLLNKYRDFINPYNHETTSFDFHNYEYFSSSLNINDPSVIFYQEEFKKKVFDYIKTLKPEDKKILNLKSENLPYSEIARRLNISKKRVDNRMCVLRRKINEKVLQREKYFDPEKD